MGDPTIIVPSKFEERNFSFFEDSTFRDKLGKQFFFSQGWRIFLHFLDAFLASALRKTVKVEAGVARF